MLASDASYVHELKRLLGAVPIDVVTATDSSDLLEYFRRANGGVTIVDLRGAGTSLLDSIAIVRQRWDRQAAPMLIITDARHAALRDAGLAAGANDHLDAPFDARMLALRLRQLTELRLLHQSNRSMREDLEKQLSIRADKLDMLIENGLMLSMARTRTELFRHTLIEGKRLLNCEAGTMYLVTPENTLRFAERTRDDLLPALEIPLLDAATLKPNTSYVSVCAAVNKQTIRINDVYADTTFNLIGTRDFDAQSGFHTVSLLTVPMAPRNGDVIGVLQFVNALDPLTGVIVPFPEDITPLVEALAAQASVALDNLQLVESQRTMMESMIQVLAMAIDAKSPYTGQHCERVPALAMMLAEVASEATVGPLADFVFSTEAEWYEFRVGAWLHDCGKITSPEYVIDKATKLETIYNRIHEVRTRFEVLLRDAEVMRLQALLDGTDANVADAIFTIEKARLIEEFTFIAQCNLGTESMHTDDLQRLDRIAERTWLRHFDDRIGISQSEAARHVAEPAAVLPATEFLISDKLHHQVARPPDSIPDPSFGFKMAIPERLYHFGERYNLGVVRGTLTEEERYKINEHMVHGIMMLERMNFPRLLRRVPEYAGTHHETLSGEGYPRKLGASELSIPARIVAIADIFEALSACDRPYKTPKRLSEVLTIMQQMCRTRHIDRDLFELMLISGVHLRYAEKYMVEAQCDVIDIRRFVSPA